MLLVIRRQVHSLWPDLKNNGPGRLLWREWRCAGCDLSRLACQFPRLRRERDYALLFQVKEVIGREQGISIDYAEILDAKTLEGIEFIEGQAVIALAVNVGKVRLINNLVLRGK